MAFLELNYYSKALGRQVTVNVLLPENKGEGLQGIREYKTLYLLHGLTGNRTDWMRRTSIERYVREYGIAVVMPEVDRSWYTDTAYGENYFTFVAKELPAVCRSYFKEMSDKREDNFVAGNSMGGYGALKVALTYPEEFAGCVSLSGSLDITRKGIEVNLAQWRSLFGFDMQSPLDLEGSKHDLYNLVRKNYEQRKEFPKLYIWCGTEDSSYILKTNRELHKVLDELNIEHTYRESEGDHSWKWWDLHIQDGLRFLFE